MRTLYPSEYIIFVSLSTLYQKVFMKRITSYQSVRFQLQFDSIQLTTRNTYNALALPLTWFLLSISTMTKSWIEIPTDSDFPLPTFRVFSPPNASPAALLFSATRSLIYPSWKGRTLWEDVYQCPTFNQHTQNAFHRTLITCGRMARQRLVISFATTTWAIRFVPSQQLAPGDPTLWSRILISVTCH
jgi:hypothetical protein